MKKITSITIKEKEDYDPDLSYLGEISHKKTYDKHWIPINPDNLSEGWFSPCNHLPYNPNSGITREEAIKYAYEDLHRLLSYGRTWWTNGIKITARFAISDDEGKHWANDERSESLWGIESDCDKKYKQEIIEDLKQELKEQLIEFGFTEDAIASAMASATEEMI